MRQVYRKTDVRKCDFNKDILQIYWNHTAARVSPVNLPHIFRALFLKSTSEGRSCIAADFLWLVFAFCNNFCKNCTPVFHRKFVLFVLIKSQHFLLIMSHCHSTASSLPKYSLNLFLIWQAFLEWFFEPVLLVFTRPVISLLHSAWTKPNRLVHLDWQSWYDSTYNYPQW